MHLRLSLHRLENQVTDLEITTDATATVGDLAHKLFVADPLRAGAVPPENLTLQIHGKGGAGARLLKRDHDLVSAGVRSGAEVSLSQESNDFSDFHQVNSARVAVLRVLQGPDAGKEFQLGAGSATIGRAPTCDVVLTDTRVSKRHARLSIHSIIEVHDQQSANGVLVNGQLQSRATLQGRDIVTLGDTAFSVVPLQGLGDGELSSVVAFNRSPRVLPRMPESKFMLPTPPKEVEAEPFPWLMMLPAMGMGAGMVLMTRNVFSLIFALMMPLMYGAMFLDQRQKAKRNYEKSVANFQELLQDLRIKVTATQEVERAVRSVESPSQVEVLDGVQRMGRLMWTQRKEFASFLGLRLGVGVVRSRVQLEEMPDGGGVAEFVREVKAFREQFEPLADAPVTANLRSCGSLGVAGPDEVSQGVARGLVAQLVGLHSPSEVVVTCFASAQSSPSWNWLKWLPHTESPHSPLSVGHLANSSNDSQRLLAALETLVSQRRGDDSSAEKDEVDRSGVESHEEWQSAAKPVVPTVIVIVEDDSPGDRARLVRLAEQGPDAGVHVLWRSRAVESLPAACRTYISCDSGATKGNTGHVRLGQRNHPVVLESLDVPAANNMARLLAPIVDAGAPVDDDSDVPRNVPFLSLIGDELAEEPQEVIERWKHNQSLRPPGEPVRLKQKPNLRAVIGHTGAEPFTLDIRNQGPHALVGGTTGAGKSELLQAWVLGMAAAHSPERVTFLFVDYKGGSAFRECIDLPHCVGLVTDLSPHLVRRALTSLRAELHYREHLFNRKKAKDLISLEMTGDPECPPTLIIIVDEFAALANEVPEFVDGVVDVAARGRSLGLHLILATQRPSGVIKDNLRANTNLRLALRMADADDSRDILEDTMAAFFDPDIPGRAAVKTGPGRLTTFQTGYAGGWTTKGESAVRVDVNELNFARGTEWEEPVDLSKQVLEEDLGPTDIARVVTTITAAAQRHGLQAPRKPWLPELADAYDLAKLPNDRTDTQLVLGVRDVPASQEQTLATYEPDIDGNISVIGAGGSGKSTFLRSIAIGAAFTKNGGPAIVYGIDFGASGLDMLRNLPHVGEIVAGDDGERLIRLVAMLKATVDERAESFAKVRASSISEYRKLANEPNLERIFVLIDGMAQFRDLIEFNLQYPKMQTHFMQVATDGRQLGIHFIMAGDKSNAVPPAVLSTVRKQIVLRLNTTDEYSSMNVAPDIISAASPPGRAVIGGLETQLAVFGGDSNLTLHSQAIDALAASMRRQGRTAAPPVRILEPFIAFDSIPPVVAGQPVLGVDFASLAPATFATNGTFMIAGPGSSGRTNAMAVVAQALTVAEPKRLTYRFALRKSALDPLGCFREQAVGRDEVQDTLDTLLADLVDDDAFGADLAVFVETVGEYSEQGLDSKMAEVLKLVARRGGFVVVEGETSTWGSSFEITPIMKAGKRGLVLMPGEYDGDTLYGTGLGRLNKADHIPGRGYLINRGVAAKVQVASLL